MAVPREFSVFEYTSPFLTLIGPVYAKTSEGKLTIGLAIEDRHCNRRNTAHGGLLTTLADIALGYTAGHGNVDGRQLTTAAMTVDFLGAARVGDWVEARAELLKFGQRLAYANCMVSVAGAPILRASGLFSVR